MFIQVLIFFIAPVYKNVVRHWRMPVDHRNLENEHTMEHIGLARLEDDDKRDVKNIGTPARTYL